jgi:hypothetical protein
VVDSAAATRLSVRRHRRSLLIAAGIAALALLTAGAWRLFLHDTATPASIEDALARYRAAAAGETAIPPGVYVYRTSGSESISALGGTTHRYPARSTITVTEAPCGMTLRWDVLQNRSNTATICVTGKRAQRLESWTESHVFFGQHDETRWECRDSPWLVDSSAVGGRMAHICDGGDATQVGTVDVVGEVPVRVGSIPVETIHLRLTAQEDGAARGPVAEERWVERETGLPVRITYRVRTSNDSPIGDVTFTERYDLHLISLDPRR